MLKKEKMSHRTGPIVMQCLKGEGTTKNFIDAYKDFVFQYCNTYEM